MVERSPLRTTGWNPLATVKTSDKDARDDVSFMVVFQRLSRRIGSILFLTRLVDFYGSVSLAGLLV